MIRTIKSVFEYRKHMNIRKENIFVTAESAFIATNKIFMLIKSNVNVFR